MSNFKACIQQDSLIQIIYKCGESESVRNYRVLVLFSKYFNKLFVHTEDSFPLVNGTCLIKIECAVVRLVEKVGVNKKSWELVAGEYWGTKQVYCVVKCDIWCMSSILIGMNCFSFCTI